MLAPVLELRVMEYHSIKCDMGASPPTTALLKHRPPVGRSSNRGPTEISVPVYDIPTR